MTTESKVDFSVSYHGNIAVLTGLSEGCIAFLKENVQFEPYQGSVETGICVDVRYIEEVINGLEAWGYQK